MSGPTKTVAEQAYSELLFMPPPTTGRDFRRAIMLAVLIGRQLESDFAGSPWQTTTPTEPGIWEAACAETEFEPQRVRVFEQDGTLMVECRDVGTATVDAYDYNLTEIRWRKLPKEAALCMPWASKARVSLFVLARSKAMFTSGVTPCD